MTTKTVAKPAPSNAPPALVETLAQLLREAYPTLARNAQLGDQSAQAWSARCREALEKLSTN